MKKLITLLTAALPVLGFSQAWIADSVSIGGGMSGYPLRGYYSLENGNQGTITFNDKDFLIDVSTPYSATIRINGGHGAALYLYTAGDTTAWATLDTTGLGAGTGWVRAWDAEDSWYPSAFEQGATGHPDYGWGTYNSVTHDVIGTKLFVYKTVTNVWKKIWIKKLGAITSAYEILIADLDGQNSNNVTISKSIGADKSFIFYSVAQDSVSSIEPNIDTYDLIFTRNIGMYGAIPQQAVTSVEINHNVLVAKADNIHVDDADWGTYTLEEKLDGIGNDWKFLDPSFQWAVQDSLSYFIQDIPGNIWQLRFTGFVGGTTGKYKFEKRKVSFVSVEENNNVVGNFNVYPNPASENVNIVYTINGDYNEGTISIMDLSGKQVYTQVVGNNNGFNNHVVNVRSLGLTSGVYILRMQIGNNQSTQKLIVN